MPNMEWQPIETAPKDGSFVILGYYGRGSCGGVEVGWWEIPPDGREAGWYNGGFRSLDTRAHPTHWMLLPLPPEPAE